MMLAVREVDELGPRGAYNKFLDLNTGMSISQVTLVSPKSEIVKLLRRALRTGNGISSIRLTGNAIDGTYVEDALIYRL